MLISSFTRRFVDFHLRECGEVKRSLLTSSIVLPMVTTAPLVSPSIQVQSVFPHGNHVTWCISISNGPSAQNTLPYMHTLKRLINYV